MNVLATYPRSRARLLSSKAAAVAVLVIVGNLATWPLYLLAASITGADVSTLNVGAATAHVTVVTMLYGALALAIGAFTGNRAAASGLTTGFLILSFLAAGLLPMFDGWEGVAKVFPWYYIDAASPLINGADWAQLGVLAAISLALFGASLWGINQRDLRAGAVRVPLLEKLRENPRLGAILGRLQGGGSARGLVSKAASDQRGLALVAGYALFLFLILLAPLFSALGDTLGSVVASMPDALLAMIGYADYSTATGWYHGEALSIYGPLVMSIVGIAAGAALAGEEKRRTIAVLLAAPVSRSRVAVSKAVAVLVMLVAMGVLVFLGILIGNGISNLGMDVGNIAAAAVLLTALGLVMGAAAYLCGALSGSSGTAVWGGTAVAVATWAINMFVGVNPDLSWFAKISPFYWLLSDHPLDNGMNWTGLAVMATASGVLAVVGWLGYQRRDLRG